MTEIHIVRYDAVVIGRQQRARCGALVDARLKHPDEPTCPRCIELEAEDDASIQALRDEDAHA